MLLLTLQAKDAQNAYLEQRIKASFYAHAAGDFRAQPYAGLQKSFEGDFAIFVVIFVDGIAHFIVTFWQEV